MRLLRFSKMAVLLTCLFIVPIVVFWSGRRYQEVKEVTKDCLSDCRFAQIRCALFAYHEKHGAFPPTRYQAEANGPVHSWRVLLVPHTDMYFKERYSKYDLLQEWNSATNLQAIGAMPHFEYFSLNGDDTTKYLAIGNGDVWPSKKPLKSCLVTQGEDRFLVVEDPNSKIHWMEPKY